MRIATWSCVVVLGLASGCGGSGPDEPARDDSAGAEVPAAPTVTGAEARALVAAGAMLLDVTPPRRAAESELEGRVHIPLDELAARMDELPRDRVIVVYCLGGGGSPVAGARLAARGYDVRVLGARANWDR